MTDRKPAARERLTPNQLDKQQQIVEAAMTALAAQGLKGCTAREIAAAAPLTKSAIHYYFADMDDLIDRAMTGHVAGFDAALRAAGTEAGDPVTAFWKTIEAYLATFRDRPHVTYLWFEYWIDTARKGRTAAVRQMHDQITRLLAERLHAAGSPHPDTTAKALFTYLLGAVVEQSVDPPDPRQICSHIAKLTGIASPPAPQA
jgi:AcrR family transcriptional regulator